MRNDIAMVCELIVASAPSGDPGFRPRVDEFSLVPAGGTSGTSRGIAPRSAS
jgi:hypothetical protein